MSEWISNLSNSEIYTVIISFLSVNCVAIVVGIIAWVKAKIKNANYESLISDLTTTLEEKIASTQDTFVSKLEELETKITDTISANETAKKETIASNNSDISSLVESAKTSIESASDTTTSESDS